MSNRFEHGNGVGLAQSLELLRCEPQIPASVISSYGEWRIVANCSTAASQVNSRQRDISAARQAR